jgi:hypothetical protein
VITSIRPSSTLLSVKPFLIALGAAAVFITLGGLRYSYNKTEITLSNGRRPTRLIGLRKQDVQKDWAKAALADKENGGHWTSLVTRIKSFALENTNERSFTNKTYGSLESNAVAVAA